MRKPSLGLEVFSTALLMLFAAAPIMRAARQPGARVSDSRLTAALSAHSRLYGLWESGPRLGEKGHRVIRDSMGSSGPPQTLTDFLLDRACRADAIVGGIVLSRVSAFTAGGHFIFSDYEVSATEIFKNNPQSPITAGDVVIVSRPGGELQFQGHEFSAIDNAYADLDIGDTYLLFLKFLPETNDYRSDDPLGTFFTQYSRVTPMTRMRLPIPAETLSKQEFIEAVRTTSNAASCK